jgi:uncharacterized protein (DUF4415 family)
MTKPSNRRRLRIVGKLEAQVQRQIAADPDDEDATDEQVAQAKPFAKAFPDLMASIKRARGRPRAEAPKEAVTLRLDPSTLAKFRSAGKDWRAKMAKALNKAKV